MTGLMMLDTDKKKTLSQKLEDCAAHYKMHFGRDPEMVFINPKADDGSYNGTIKVRHMKEIQICNFWLCFLPDQNQIEIS